MAFGEVTPINFGQSVSYNDTLSLAAQTQDAMQQKYDVNTAKIEGMVEQISAIPIQQQAGKKYLMDKLQGVLNTVSANMKVSGGFGILSNSYTGGITSQIKGAIDDKVKKHIKYSADIINFEKGVAKLREKDPKLYNQANYDFAQYKAGLQNYLQGDENADLGSLQYNPYKDVFGDATKKAKDLKDLKGDQEIETVSADGKTIIKRKISGLTVDEVIKYIPGILDSQDEQQMMIDGWSDVRGTKDGGKSSLEGYFNQKKARLQEEITANSAIDKNNSDEATYNTAQERIKDYKKQIADIDANIPNIASMPPEQVGYMLKKGQVVNSMAGMFSGRESITYDINPVWKEENDLHFKQANLEIAQEGLAIKKAKALQEGLKKDEKGNYITDPLAGVASAPVTNQELQDMSPENVVSTVQGKYNENYNGLINEVSGTFEALPDTSNLKKSFISNMKLQGFDYNSANETFTAQKGTKASKAGAMYQSYLDSRMNTTNPEQEIKLIDLEKERQKLSKLMSEAQNKATTEAKKIYTEEQGKNEFDLGDAFTLSNPILGVRAGIKAFKNIKNETGVIFAPSLLTIPGQTGIITYKKDRLSEITNEKLGKYLKEAGAVKSILDKNNMIVSGGKVGQITSMISSDMVSGEQFDTSKDAPAITIFKNADKTYTIKQFQGTDKNGRKEAIAVVPMEAGTLGQMLNSMTVDKENYDSTFDYEIGKPILPNRKPTIASKINDGVQTNMVNAMKAQIKDAGIVRELVNFSVKPYSAFLFKQELINQGLDAQLATTYATKIVDKVGNGTIQPNLIPEKNGWYMDVGGIRTQVGTSDRLSQDVNYAMRLYPAQTALSMIYNQIKDKGLEELQALYGDGITNLFK